MEHGPRHQQALFLRPFEDGDLDRAVDAGRNCRGHLFALERSGDAFALELEAVVVDRTGDIDCEHQSYIGSVGSRGYAERRSQRGGKSRRHPWTAHSTSWSG